MVDRDLVIAKAGSIQKHLYRIAEKSGVDINTFLSDIDRREIISFNQPNCNSSRASNLTVR
jgi:hypothetical protein